MSATMMFTIGAIPLPPIPENACRHVSKNRLSVAQPKDGGGRTLAAMSSFMFLARPQKRHPRPKMTKQRSNIDLRPKTSLSFP